MTITKQSHTRLTLALDIDCKLADGPFSGYHKLGIIKHQIKLFDTISVENSTRLSIACDNEHVPCDERNICWRAVELIRKRLKIDKSVAVRIKKNIPVMGGLAGGSANAATMLKILDGLWGLELPKSELIDIGRELGMDVPFFFEGGTAFDTETTGVLEPIKSGLNFTFILVLPEFGVSTRDAYSGIDYNFTGKRCSDTTRMIQSLHNGCRDEVVTLMHNDFEHSVFAKYPRLEQLRDRMLLAGCEKAVMSGSGSTLVGVVPDEAIAHKISESIDCRTIITQTLL